MTKLGADIVNILGASDKSKLAKMICLKMAQLCLWQMVSQKSSKLYGYNMDQLNRLIFDVSELKSLEYKVLSPYEIYSNDLEALYTSEIKGETGKRVNYFNVIDDFLAYRGYCIK